MVKGVSRQVIVVKSPDPKLFEEAIFILRDNAVGQDGVTEQELLREAKKLLGNQAGKRKPKFSLYGPAWACLGAVATGAVWLLSIMF